MLTYTVKPKDGLTIVDPVLKDILPPEGRMVEESFYWHRMIQCGDVVVVEPAKGAAQKGKA